MGFDGIVATAADADDLTGLLGRQLNLRAQTIDHPSREGELGNFNSCVKTCLAGFELFGFQCPIK